MVRLILFLSIFLFTGSLVAQQPLEKLSKEELKKYNKIRSHVKKTPDTLTTDVAALSNYLTESLESDLEKVRSIYLWIALNITYDMKSFLKGRYYGQTVPDVLDGKKGICEGYANLFSALCNEVEIENTKILGYSKGYGYNPGQVFAVSNHAWNSVKLDDEWFLLDVTWAASQSNDPEFYSSENNLEKYFLTSPDVFLVDHLPEDPEWQLLEAPISMEDFESGKNVPKGEKKKKVAASTDVYGKEINHYLRATRHNSRNKDARFRLGYAYLSKALDTLEVIHDQKGDQVFENIEQLDIRITELLEEAEKHFGMLDKSYSGYKKARNLLIECNFQKGVFNYEAGYQILSLMIDMDQSTYYQQSVLYSQEVNKYWDTAIEFFERVPPGSLYKEQADRYIDYYIPEFRP